MPPDAPIEKDRATVAARAALAGWALTSEAKEGRELYWLRRAGAGHCLSTWGDVVRIVDRLQMGVP
jgi:hypothetical protein